MSERREAPVQTAMQVHKRLKKETKVIEGTKRTIVSTDAGVSEVTLMLESSLVSLMRTLPLEKVNRHTV